MPQLDKYIFLNQVLALIFFFFITYIYVRSTVIPNLNMSLKYRHKSFAKLANHDYNNWRLFHETNRSLSHRALKQLNFINQKLNNIFISYKNKYNIKFINLIFIYSLSKYLSVLINLKLNNQFIKFIHLINFKIFSFIKNNYVYEQLNQVFIKNLIRSTSLLVK